MSQSVSQSYEMKELNDKLSRLSDGDLIYVPSNIVSVNDHFGRIQKSRSIIEHEDHLEIPVYLVWIFSKEHEKEGVGGLEIYGYNSSIAISPGEKIYTGPDALRHVEKLPIDRKTMSDTLSKRFPF